MLQASLAPLAWLALPAAGRAAWTAPASPQAPAIWFFDERFDAARRLAEARAGAGRLIAVRGDATNFARKGLAGHWARRAVALEGVTTESFHFCLSLLLRERGRIETRCRRLDGDLHRWTIQPLPDSEEVIVA